MKTFIKWSGNKSKHLGKITPYIPEFSGTYIEPFVGSGAMLLKLQPKKWIINDLNKDLINIWKDIKNNPEEIIKGFKEFGKYFKKMSNNNKVKLCRKITSNIENMNYDIERSLVYLLMKYCVYMSNIIINNKFYFKGLDLNIFNNNYSFLKEKNYENLIDVNKFLNNTNGKIYNKDYKKIFEKAKQDDFVFLDPPYIENHDYYFNYNKDEILETSFLDELLKELDNLDKKKVKWLMTQADTKEINEKFKKYNIKTFKVYRHITKSYKNELIIMNYNII